MQEVEFQTLVDEVCQALTLPGAKPNVPDYNNNRTEHPREKGDKIHWNTFEKPIDDLAKAIGRTPLFEAKKLVKAHGLKCKLYLKLEFMNAGGSVKDRISQRMIEMAESEGKLRKGDYVIEATSGNTGVGLAMMCAMRGYKMVVCMPHKMSMDKENTLKALGATVIRTRTSANWNDADSHISIAYTLRDRVNAAAAKAAGDGAAPRAVVLDQYLHPGNVDAHYTGTAEEILEQTGRKIDMFVASCGTGGTMTGTAERIKKEVPTCTIVGVDPIGSILSYKKGTYDLSKDIKSYEVEGIGYDFHPQVFHHDAVDVWYRSADLDSLKFSRELIALEGALCGGSAGSALSAVYALAKDLTEHQTVVVIVPDSIRNYLSKFVNDDWMLTHGLFGSVKEHSQYQPHKPLTGFGSYRHQVSAVRAAVADTVDSALAKLHAAPAPASPAAGASHLIVLTSENRPAAVVSKEELLIWKLQRKGDTGLKELLSPHSIYLFDAADQSDAAREEARLALLAHNGEGKTRDGCLVCVPDALKENINKQTNMLQKRAIFMNWTVPQNETVKLITMDTFAQPTK